MILPWGKFKGCEISELPDSYLRWLFFDADKLSEDIEYHVSLEMVERYPEKFTVRINKIMHGIGRSEIDRVRRSMAFKYHPDKGGSPLAMQAINVICDDLIDICS